MRLSYLYSICFGLALLIVPQLGLAVDQDFEIKRIDSSTISYKGRIVAGQSFSALEGALTDATTTLLINSQGGSLLEGVRMGLLISERKLNVVVEAYCLSSCANNIFLAGHTKRLRVGAVLGFHGAMNLRKEQIETFEALNEADLHRSLDRTEGDFDDFAIQEWYLLRQLKIQPDIHVSLMAKLSAALPPKKVNWVVTLGNRKFIYADLEEGKKRIIRYVERNSQSSSDSNSPWQLERDNPYADAVFFPRQSSLEKFGVNGIIEYAYPKDAKELKAITKALIKTYNFQSLRAVGEFSDSSLKLGGRSE